MNQRNTLRTLAAGAILLATAGAAVAQSSASGDDFKRPLGGGGRAKVSKVAPRPPQAEQSGHSITVMRQDDGDNTVELRIENGEYSAKVNGKEVPQDRIVYENDEVRILGKDGNAVSTFHISTDPIAGVVVEGVQPPAPAKAPRAPKAPRAATGRATPAQPAQPPVPAQLMVNPPRVMLGITMDAPSESLLKNYSLKEGEAILVQRVADGLPADKAGLKDNDIITEIDGKKPVNQEILREVLRSKEPGDTVEFTILRKGGDKSVRVTLDKYDQEKLGVSLNLNPGDGGMTLWNNADPEAGDAHKLAEKAFRDALKNHPQWQTFTMPGDGQSRAFVLPGNGPDMDKKLAELDKKMADLDKKLERVDAQMAKLQELLEKLSRQNGR